MSPSAECGHCFARRPRRPKRRASATGFLPARRQKGEPTAGCRPLLEYETPADWVRRSYRIDLGVQRGYALTFPHMSLMTMQSPLSPHRVSLP
jgi:hypothetical protein